MRGTQAIASFLGKLAAEVNVPFAREDQQGDKLAYPFMSYKIINIEPEPEQCNIVEYMPAQTGENMIRKTERTQVYFVSVTFTGGQGDYGALTDIAYKAWDFVDSLKGFDEAYLLGIGVATVSGVGDRTVFLDTEWEYRLGFDIRFIIKGVREEQVLPVQEIEINPA